MRYREALNQALREEMEADENVFIMGEDIAGGTGAPGDQDSWGGPMGVTKGLRPQFGPDRVLDTHLAEISFVGAAAGAAPRRRARAPPDRGRRWATSPSCSTCRGWPPSPSRRRDDPASRR